MTVIVDYGLGNLFSVAKAFEMIGASATVTRDPEKIRSASRIVLPGVGAFGTGMNNIKERGLLPALEEAVIIRRIPFLGICLGMQLLAEFGTEYGENKGLGWIKGSVQSIVSGKEKLKVPHIGWNQLAFKREHPLFEGVKNNADFYFVHSFHLVPANGGDTVATTDYGGDITAAVIKDNIAGVQFHPEKSQENGLKILENFVNWFPQQ